MRSLAVILAGALGVAIYSPAQADEPFYLGTWKFEFAVVAPWAEPPQKPDEAEMKALIGKTVTIAPKAISGPKVSEEAIIAYLRFHPRLSRRHGRTCSSQSTSLIRLVF